MRRLLLVSSVVLVACSSNHAANPNAAEPPPSATASAGTAADTTTGSTEPSTSSPDTTAGTTTSTTTGPLEITGRAVAGTAGEVDTAEPFILTDPFAEAVRLADGTCVGWSGSRGGSTLGLAVGAPLTVLDADDNSEVGAGTITASRWEDVSGGGGQFMCTFDFAATLTSPQAEFRIKVGGLAPWLARPDPTAPGTYTASVSTDASVGLIEECPAVPAEPDPTATTAAPTTTLTPPPTTPAPAPVTGWNAVGQYWSNGVRALCAAGLPVVAIARPCRPAGVASEYITQVVNAADPATVYANGGAIPAGTQLAVVVAIGIPCG